jgi:hypothetical protein
MLGTYWTKSFGNISLSMIAVLGVPAAVFSYLLESDVNHKRIATVPPYSDLQTASGTLERGVGIGGGRSFFALGIVDTNDGDVLGFSCNPLDADIGCVYSTKPYDESQFIGKPVTIKYYTMPNWLYPEYKVGDGSGRIIPRRPANIVMEATTTDRLSEPLAVLSYKDSLSRLNKYNSGWHIPLSALLSVLLIGIFLPSAAYRLLGLNAR